MHIADRRAVLACTLPSNAQAVSTHLFLSLVSLQLCVQSAKNAAITTAIDCIEAFAHCCVCSRSKQCNVLRLRCEGAIQFITAARLAPALMRADLRLDLVSPRHVHTDISVLLQDIDGRNTQMKKYKGKVVLAVNVASQCGFTKQYKVIEREP